MPNSMLTGIVGRITGRTVLRFLITAISIEFVQPAFAAPNVAAGTHRAAVTSAVDGRDLQSYRRTARLCAGVALAGATLKPDNGTPKRDSLGRTSFRGLEKALSANSSGVA